MCVRKQVNIKLSVSTKTFMTIAIKVRVALDRQNGRFFFGKYGDIIIFVIINYQSKYNSGLI